ncbi:tetracycline resistance protein tetM [Paenibacillus thiaminolyticus]|uniref:Tetracycline resistance protein tetM n=1 Tax=Paenibacillus thiaminolyticus TaxID=49283 RepID=A0AAP9DQQ4_PANTH|nr:tetracycline resistance protein tetM [Paenibacillus thiaminolyticus]
MRQRTLLRKENTMREEMRIFINENNQYWDRRPCRRRQDEPD